MISDVIKEIAIQAIGSLNLVEISTGLVESVEPLRVFVDQRFRLSDAQLVQTETTTKLSVTIGSSEYLIRRGLEVGDKILLMRVQGGQQYVILDRVVG